MIGPNKWHLLILYSAYVVAAENLSSDDLRIEQIAGTRTAKNLLPPFQPFSAVDNVRYIDNSLPKNDAQFGSFRFVDHLSSTNAIIPNNRRSDNNNLVVFPHSVLPSSHPSNATIAANLISYRDNSTSATATTTSHVVEIVESIDLTDSARRSGFKYPETTFIPQGYSEDHSAAFDAAGVRRPFFDQHHNEFTSSLTDVQQQHQDGNDHLRLAELFGHALGGIGAGAAGGGGNGQIGSRNQIEIAAAESTVQPVRIIPDQLPAESQRLRGYPQTIYYANNNNDLYRSRHYFPPKPEVFGEFQVIKKFPSTWKSRTPRVIFPIPDIPSAPGPPYTSDSVVFK